METYQQEKAQQEQINNQLVTQGREVVQEQNALVAEEKVLSELEKEYAVAETEGFARVLDNWRNLSCTLGQNVRVVLGTNSYTGKAVDIDKDGCLLVDTGNEVNRVIAGDVSIRPAE